MKTCKRGLHHYEDGKKQCPDCKRADQRNRRSQINARKRVRRVTNLEAYRAKGRARYYANPEQHNARMHAHYRANAAQTKAGVVARRLALVEEFYQQYGSTCVGTADGHPCEWQCTNREALTIGHLFNDGGAHRSRLKGNRKRTTTAAAVILDLKRRGWPKNEGIAPQCGSCQYIDLRRFIASRRKAS